MNDPQNPTPTAQAAGSEGLWPTVLAMAVIVVPCVGIGAWLVVQEHPWFGLLAMSIGGSISISSKRESE